MSRKISMPPRKAPPQASPGIDKLIVENFKSLAKPDPYEFEIRPLTLLAGANSSGKSSAVQPLLLLKQTVESSYDPGPLLLNGSHVRFSSTSQILPVHLGSSAEAEFMIGVESERLGSVWSRFRGEDGKRVELVGTRYATERGEIWVEPALSAEEIASILPAHVLELRETMSRDLGSGLRFFVFRDSCFYQIGLGLGEEHPRTGSSTSLTPSSAFEALISRVIHVPGLRGNPERSYRTTAVGPLFPGTFEPYVASLLHSWKKEGSPRLEDLNQNLRTLGLTSQIDSKQLDAASVEIRVGRRLGKRVSKKDLVNIADVGFGVSQTLPVLVALLTAEPGQLVYIEQPELHLHPRAQVALAEVLANASRRGVKVLVETHSALLLLSLQSLVAEGKLPVDEVILHWFQRDKDGISEVTSAELDEQGAYGDWPEDFGEILMGAQGRYLDAVDAQFSRAVGE